MSSHTCPPGHPGILADDCERCAEHAAEPMLLGLDERKTQQLWDKMLAVEFGDEGNYVTGAEEEAARKLYLLGVWLEQNLGVRPWVPLEQLQQQLRGN